MKIRCPQNLALFCSLLTTAVITTEAIPDMTGAFRETPIPMYKQQIELKFSSEQSAKQARLRIAPVYDGHDVAITCRWDDANDQTTTAHKLMAQRGIKGTYYLNSNWQSDLHRDDDYTLQALQLLGDGQSIGGHSMTHPYITYLNRNRMFEEMLEVRIEWEARLNTAINSYTYSYVDIRNDVEGDAVHADTLRCLQRAGYQGIAEFAGHADRVASDLAFSTILAPENSPYDQWRYSLDWALTDAHRIARRNAVSNSMHSWYGTSMLPFGWDVLEKRLDDLQAVPDAWHCNQNEFAAYWQQSEHSKLRIKREGATVKLSITRPSMSWLNDPIPLSLLLEGVDPSQLTAITGADVQRHGNILNVPHSDEHRMPQLIGAIHNDANDTDIRYRVDDPDFPGLHAILYRSDGQLQLQIINQSAYPVSNLRAQYRLPLMHPQGVIARSLPDLGLERQCRQRLPLSNDPQRDPADSFGEAFYAVQLEFMWGDVPSRLYVTCRTEPIEDSSLPTGRFQVMGPFAPDQFDFRLFEQCKTADAMSNAMGVPWENRSTDLRVDPQWVHPEVIITSGTWRNLSSGIYILRGTVTSPVRREVKISGFPGTVKRVLLNGQLISNMQGKLKVGANELMLVYHFEPTARSSAHLGCFLRICDTQGHRIRDIQYSKEPL